MIVFNRDVGDVSNAMDTIISLHIHSPNKPIGKYLRGAMRPHYPLPVVIYDLDYFWMERGYDWESPLC